MIDKSFLEEFVTPITDRTEADVDELRRLLEKGYKNFTSEEKTLWGKDHKGALNASDLNRIESNSVCLGKCLGIEINTAEFEPAQFLYVYHFNNIISGLQKVIDEVSKYTTVSIPTMPDYPFNDYIKINLIEEIQYIIYNIINDYDSNQDNN